MDEKCKCEHSASDKEPLAVELEGYKKEHTLLAADRDGDLYFIECPECHSLDIHTIRLFACRCCHTFFKVYTEDGLRVLTVENDFGSIGSYGNELKLLKLSPEADTHKILFGRNEHRLSELKEKYPKMKVVTLERDLHGGHDAHGHEKYKKYALIPLGD